MKELKQLIEDAKKRFSQIFTVQTQEVIVELNKMLELLENPVSAESKKEIKDVKQPNTTKPKVEKKEEPKTQEAKEETIEKSIEELRSEYKEKFNKNPFNGWNKDVLLSKLK